MPNVWGGADPAGVVDAGDYELGTVVEALESISLTHVRVWSPANAVDRPSRKGHIWSISGTLLATVNMPEALTAGWSTHALTTPMTLDPGDFVVASYESSGNYGFIAAALGTDSHISADQAAAFPQSQAVLVAGSSTTGNGRFSQPPGTVPNSSNNHAFYGVDIVYTVTSGTAPTITGLSLPADGLTVTATITATDPEGLTGATYAVDWGDGQASSGASSTLAHTYATAGVKALLASVTDSTGLKGYKAGAVRLVAPTQTARKAVRVGIAQYFGGTTLSADNWYQPTPLQGNGLAGVRPYYEARTDDSEYLRTVTAGRAMGAVMVVHVAEFTERRLTTGGFFDVPYVVHLYLYHYARKPKPEDAQDDLDKLIQAVIDRVHADPTLGGVVTQAGETSRGITSSMSTPVIEPGTPPLIRQDAVITFAANTYPFYLTD